jgi:3-deoxy-7-phosphoheptulonate synthase
MVIVMSPNATDEAVHTVVSTVEEAGAAAFVSRGVTRTIVGVVAGEPVLAALEIERLAGVAEVVRITAPYKLVSRENHVKTSTINVGGVPIGPDSVTLIAGPCAVETPEQTVAAALMARQAGAALLRGGAFKPRTSPYAFQGLGVDGLKILAETRAETGLPVVTEVVDPSDVDVVAEYADMLQVGTRNMQNFALLQAVGSVGKPVLLKRGLTATYEEWLMAAEYIAQRGNLDIVLCERGVRSFEPAIRNMLDVSAVPMIHQLSHLPIVVDPSHAAGRRELVVPLARAAMGAGAEGLLIDVHPHPESARCDGPQALHGATLDELGAAVRTLPPALGRTLAVPPPVPAAGTFSR